MNMPEQLREHLEEALVAVQADPQADLSLDKRLPIYEIFDSLPDLKGRTARTHVSLSVTQRVLPLNNLPDDDGRERTTLMHTLAEQLLHHLQQGVTAEQLHELAEDMKTTFTYWDDFFGNRSIHLSVQQLAFGALERHAFTGEAPTSLYYPAWCVYLSAMTTLFEALGFGWWDGDAGKWAVIAYAGGTWTAFEEQDLDDFTPQGTWDYSSPDVITKRREFWEWWCREAVLDAWATVAA